MIFLLDSQFVLAYKANMKRHPRRSRGKAIGGSNTEKAPVPIHAGLKTRETYEPAKVL